MEDVSILHSREDDSLITLRSSSGGHLRPDYRSADPAHTLILISKPALEPLL